MIYRRRKRLALQAVCDWRPLMESTPVWVGSGEKYALHRSTKKKKKRKTGMSVGWRFRAEMHTGWPSLTSFQCVFLQDVVNTRKTQQKVVLNERNGTRSKPTTTTKSLSFSGWASWDKWPTADNGTTKVGSKCLDRTTWSETSVKGIGGDGRKSRTKCGCPCWSD